MSNMLTLYQYGQSMWLDYIDRDLLVNGGLARLVEEGLRGVTSNPTIFHKAITGGHQYDDAIRDLLQADPQMDAETLYEWLAIQDVQWAADILRPVYENSNGTDGFVSLEVSPHLAGDTAGTVEGVHHLWRAVDRPNLMIKVPGTREGLPAIERLIGEGININVTLLFSVARYEEVVGAYVSGLGRHPDPARVTSVASFFVSRIDGKVDLMLDRAGTPEARRLKGRAAIANAKMAYQRFRALTRSEAFRDQVARGARVQRLLWGSTSTKNRDYSDLLYVDGLIGADTVNTVPPQTLDAFQDHGTVALTLERDVEQARRDQEDLAALGIDLDAVTRELEEEGVAAFAESHDKLLAALEEKRVAVTRDYAGA
ncbi:MAG: transaldolase [Gammaproteobacteria bacterium]|nr:transaldolase [Gammaproteobacteria bacterium]NIR83971.1 transaldolase [Gammaproteobacteria bacterium]NIR89115.1 transaldolase [Gammaproteobacteria bacterium]NIU04917.1 transaldolase [Gammaproteobacteria bacterium]NIV52083.1 transaldolase [Gammaproteobacteria bacterium]